MSERLPKWIDPVALISRDGELIGELPLSTMARLSDACEAASGSAEIALRFSSLGKGQRIVSGTARAEVALTCQRCMLSVPWTLAAEIALAVVRNQEQAERLPEHLEPLLLPSDGRVQLSELVEDELILALPLVARHPRGECSAAVENPPVAETTSDGPNPFAVLKGLK